MVAVDFPLRVARVAMSMYRAERHMPLDKAMVSPVTPMMGTIAGCTNAMALLKVYMVRELDKFVRNHPPVILDMYVDDGSILSAGSRSSVFNTVVNASVEVDEVFGEDLELPVARDKGELIASDGELGHMVAKRLGKDVGSSKA